MGTQGYRHPFKELPPMQKKKILMTRCGIELQLYEKLGSDRVLVKTLAVDHCSIGLAKLTDNRQAILRGMMWPTGNLSHTVNLSL